MTKNTLYKEETVANRVSKTKEEMNFDIQLGNRILEILKQQQRSQKWLADKLNLSESKMSRMLSGRSSLSAYWIREIAECLNVSVMFLLYGMSNRSSNSYKLIRIKNMVRDLCSLIDEVVNEIP